jgi:hypothetical protein
MSKRKSLFGNPKASSLTSFDHIEKKPSPRKSLTIGTPVSFDIHEAPPTSEELLERGQIQKKLKEYFPNSSRHYNKDPIAESEYLCNVDKILASYLLSSAGYEYVSGVLVF